MHLKCCVLYSNNILMYLRYHIYVYVYIDTGDTAIRGNFLGRGLPPLCNTYNCYPYTHPAL